MAKNLIKEYLDNKERTYQDGGEITDSWGHRSVSEWGMDYYNAAMQRMKELYESDSNHEYHTIMFNKKGNYKGNLGSDAEQGLSFEDWLNTRTGQYYHDSVVENFSRDFSPISVTKTTRRGKEKTISREVDPKHKEKFIQDIMNSDDPHSHISKVFQDYGPAPQYKKETIKVKVHGEDPNITRDITKEKQGNIYPVEKMYRWIKKAEKGNPKFKINE